jgi:hypothetical protein
MTDNDYIKKKAQIEILEYLMNHLCNVEMSDIGRTATKRIIKRLRDEISNAQK